MFVAALPVLERFGHMRGLYRDIFLEVSDGPGYLDQLEITAGGQLEPFGRLV